MGTRNGRLVCDMEDGCAAPITHIDDRGYIYCHPHGLKRKFSGRRCRLLTSGELKRLHATGSIASYRRSNPDSTSHSGATRSEVRSPTRTSTSTRARTTGNITVTGGAGAGATTSVTIRRNPGRSGHRYVWTEMTDGTIACSDCRRSQPDAMRKRAKKIMGRGSPAEIVKAGVAFCDHCGREPRDWSKGLPPFVATKANPREKCAVCEQRAAAHVDVFPSSGARTLCCGSAKCCRTIPVVVGVSKRVDAESRRQSRRRAGEGWGGSPALKNPPRFREGDIIQTTGNDSYAGIAAGSVGVCVAIQGGSGHSVHPDPVGMMLYCHWYGGRRDSVLTKLCKKIGKVAVPDLNSFKGYYALQRAAQVKAIDAAFNAWVKDRVNP